VRFCLDHLTEPEQRALEKDIDLASRIQGALLPRRSIEASGWAAAYHYEGAGPVSGDYCDLAELQGRLHFAVGDVTGKGVAASMLMTHLHATLRALLSPEVALDQLVERVNRGFCESTLPTHYATLVCGRAGGEGEVEICNAGHLPPLLLRAGGAEWIGPTGLPVGISGEARFGVTSVRLRPGDALVLYTDGLTEAPDPSGAEYGRERLRDRLSAHSSRKPQDLLAATLEDLRSFRMGASKSDDLTLMAIGRLD
jgi:sigma-B regulation protein RsbU (phosphoserine phosphatase)